MRLIIRLQKSKAKTTAKSNYQWSHQSDLNISRALSCKDKTKPFPRFRSVSCGSRESFKCKKQKFFSMYNLLHHLTQPWNITRQIMNKIQEVSIFFFNGGIANVFLWLPVSDALHEKKNPMHAFIHQVSFFLWIKVTLLHMVYPYPSSFSPTAMYTSSTICCYDAYIYGVYELKICMVVCI